MRQPPPRAPPPLSPFWGPRVFTLADPPLLSPPAIGGGTKELSQNGTVKTFFYRNKKPLEREKILLQAIDGAVRTKLIDVKTSAPELPTCCQRNRSFAETSTNKGPF